MDEVIVRALGGKVFMKTFAGALVQNMEKQSKSQSHVGCYRLLSWSCLLLSKSKFAAVSKNALCRVAAAQASLLSLVLQRSFREGRACRKKIFRLFSQVQPNCCFFYFINTIIAMSSILCSSLRDGICTENFTTKLYDNERKRGDREVMSDATVSEKILLYKLMYDSL